MAEERIEPQILKDKFTDDIQETSEFRGDLTVVIPREKNVEILQFIKEDERLLFDLLVDVTCVDYLNYPETMPERFAVVYHLYSLKSNIRLRVKAFIPAQDMNIRTLTGLWQAADWLERETYDMFGIQFEGHPDLRRILMPDDFGSFPLQKDYPLKGRGERDDFKVVK